jgi:hypothetical protein
MTRKQITEMLAGLDDVAPSPWRYDSPNREDGDPGFIRSGEGDNSITVAVLYHHADTRHLASCDPSTIRALCELALRALRYETVNPSDFRYWEGRYRDEAAENERLQRERDEALARVAELESLPALEERIAPVIAEAGRRARAKAIDEAVAAIKEQKKVFQSKEYAGGPLGSLMEVFACNKCEEAVAALERKPE